MRTVSLLSRCTPAVLGLGLLALTSLAARATDVYTDKATFLTQLLPGSYYESFDSFSGNFMGPQTFTNGTYSYDASAPGGLDGIEVGPGDNALIADFFVDTTTLTFTSGNVHAIGGSFFPVGFSGAPLHGDVTLTLSDGTTQVVTSPVDGDQPFIGFVSPSGVITSLTESSGFFHAINDLYVGNAASTPEPGALALLLASGLGGGFHLYLRRKRLCPDRKGIVP